MNGLGLLLGHLIGDFILQGDWLSRNKTIQPTPPELSTQARALWQQQGFGGASGFPPEVHEQLASWHAGMALWWQGNFACLLHCMLYTIAVAVCSFWWMPWWGLLACFVAHFPIDRWRLARVWMERVSRQREFANGAFAPWSVIVVDNCFHLLTLFVIGALAGA